MGELTTEDVLTLVGDQAQWCREEGECDMRYITGMVRDIRRMAEEGKSREEIIEHYKREDE